MGMESAVAALVEEAEQRAGARTWQMTPEQQALALQAAAGLNEAVGAARKQESLPDIERLAHLREALAALAIALARTHGPLAWFIGAGVEALSPILHWRALPADETPSFGTTHPAPARLTDAESAVRQLAAALSRIAA
ncbi:hypothetical protein ACIRSU_02940 [Streptomyces sp. NPDC101160]|uniref:hypothetical protein n=1 Tax=Streptomyces sp. NPDC101160 TaxID=3366118 RepID=UPI003813BAA0